MSKKEVQKGLTYISDRGSQLRYSDNEGKEQWIQQVSRYKALEKIERGQAVSIAYAQEFEEYAKKAIDEIYDSEAEDVRKSELDKLNNDPDPFVVLTDTTKHIKCVGLALEPANVGEEIHILPFGKFTFDKKYEDAHNSESEVLEYNPNFTYDDVGKRVYVKYAEEGTKKGELTVNEDETLKHYQNIICVGYLTDAPRKDSVNQTTTIELSIQGDYRGPVEHTQFEGILGEDVTLSKSDPIRLFAIGKEKDDKFHSFLRFTPQGEPFKEEDFIAVQKLDGKTAFIYPVIEGISRDTFDLDKVTNDNDKSFIYMSKVYNKGNNVPMGDGCYQIELNDDLTVDGVKKNIEAIKTALTSSFKFITGDSEFELTYTPNESSNPDTKGFFGNLDILANKVGGYYEIYISSGLLDRFTGSTTMSHGSFNNEGKLVLADIRIPTRREVLGAYIGKELLELKANEPYIFMRMGEYRLSEDAIKSKFFEIGNEYYLGFNGRLSKNPYIQYEFTNKVAFQKDKDKLIFDIGSSKKYYNGAFPVGYMKPSINGCVEYGFLRMDGEGTYEKDAYPELYTRLIGWFPKNEVDISETSFKIPKVCKTVADEENGGHKDVPMQIKYLAEGIYEDLPIMPFLRDYNNFEEENKENKNIKPTIKDFDITSLIDASIEESGFNHPDISNLDIHLYVDINYKGTGAHDWIEIKEGFFNYNNTNTFGFNWKLNVQEVSDANPYGKISLTTDIGKGDGIAYVTGSNVAPKKLFGCPYKVYVAKRNLYPAQFDLSGLSKNYISNSVYVDDLSKEPILNKAVSGKAVIDAINHRKDIDSLQVNEGANIELGKENSTLGSLSIVSKGTVPVVADKIEIFNNFDTIEESVTGEPLQIKKERLTFENDKAYLRNAKNENIFSLDTSNDTYSVDGEQIPTVNQVRTHAELTIDDSISLKDILKQGKSNKEGAIHGMVFGIGGNIDASTLEGLKLRLNSTHDLEKSSKLEGAYIPYAYKDEKNNYHQNVEGSLDFITKDNEKLLQNKVLLNRDTNKVTYNYSLNDPTLDKFSINVANTQSSDKFNFKQEFNFKTGNFEFYKVNSTGSANPADILAGNLLSGSRSEYKKIYGEKRRSDLYVNVDGIEENIPWTELDSESIKYTDGELPEESTNKFTTLLGSALQAAYELPIAYWQYRTEEDWYKKSMGVIVERVEDVAREFNDTMKRKLFDGIDGSDFEYPDGSEKVVNHNEFKYTSKEVESIKAYLSDIINNSSTGVNITDTVGLLLNAAQETQERLLKIETSTFGDDYETIPGDRGSYNLEGLDKNVTSNPTNLGLNRLIRAICLEIYQTANPYDAADFDVDEGGGGKPILSRIDRLDIDIHGKLNEDTEGNKTAKNELSSINSTTYPYNDIVYGDIISDIRKSESTTPEQKEIAKELGTDVKTRQNMETADVESTTNNKFNGVVDAIYRITTKLNALTESVNGEDNIANAPLRLNTIRQNIEHIIRENYLDDKNVINEVGEPVMDTDGNGTPIYTRNFETKEATPYVDTNEKLDIPFEENTSRFDRLTKALYDFTISRENASQEFGTFKEFGEEVQEDSIIPVYYTGRQFNGKCLLTDTNADEVKSHVPQNLNDYNYATLLDIVVDAIGDQFYRNNTLRRESDSDASFAKEISRHNKTISSRLDEIEKALDRVVLKLSRKHHFENDTGSLIKTSFSIESYTEFLNEYLGYSQESIDDSDLSDDAKPTFEHTWKDGIDSEEVTGKYSAEYAITKKKNIQAGLVNTLYRLQKEEATSKKYDSILGDEFSSNSKSITQSVNEEGIGEDSYQKNYITSSTYTLTDDIKDLLKTVYGLDSAKDIDNPKDDTLYEHRTLVTSDKPEDRFVNNTKDDNIIDKMVNEAYYLPQPLRIKSNSDADFNGSSSDLVLINNGDEKDSRYANYYDFDKGTNIYDIKEGEKALSNNNRQEFFNQIGRNVDTDIPESSSDMHYRKSRYQVIEDEIRSERKLLGNNLGYTDYNNNRDAINLKFNSELKLDTNLKTFKGVTFNNVNNIDPATDQYNKPEKNTSILEFMLGTDKSTRDIRNEIGIKGSEEGSSKYYNPTNHSIESQEDTNKKSIYSRVYTVEKDLVKFTSNTSSLLKWN